MSNKVRENTVKNKTLFTIDLLKGRGIPPRSGPVGLTIAVITVLVPLIIAITLYGLHRNNKIVTEVQKKEILKLQEKTAKLSDAVTVQKTLEKEKVLYKTCLEEVKASIDKFYQWSPVLVTLAEEMPDSVVLTDLQVEHKSVLKEIPKKNNPDRMTTVDVAVTKLIIWINNQGQGDYDEQVKDFRDRLYASDSLGSKIDQITFSRDAENNNGTELVSYRIECSFKSEL
jgi:hypothetical protein